MNKSKSCIPFSYQLYAVLGTLLLVLFSHHLSAQINFNNPGLNGTSGAGAAPPQWTVCSSTPDVQPGQWCVETPPKEGSTYAGFSDDEFLGQRLNCALVEGKNYSMSLWLAYNPDYARTQALGTCPDRGVRGNPGNFQLWAGTVNCSKQELLYESGTLTPEHEDNWVEHIIKFKPNNTYDFILICAEPDNGSSNVMVDNISQQIVQEPDSFSVDNSNIVCFGDETATATVFPPNIGGSNYSYLWDTSPAQTTQTATGLGAGTYTCTITDNNGPCTTTYDVTVTVTGPPELVVNMVCNDVSALPANGSVAAQPSGGVPPYSYSWSTSSITDSVLTNLDAGTYEVTVTDAKGCTVVGSCEILNPLCNIELTGSSFENPSCFEANDGSASITVASSNTPITYEWNTTPVRTTASIDDLGPGTYTVVATDAENCTVTETFTLEEPPALTLALNGDSASCFGIPDAQAVAVVSGGTPDYNYSWPGSNTDTYVGPAGDIICTVTDANGCEISESIFLGEPTEIELTAETTSASCPEVSDGGITATATGGESPYEFGLTQSNLQTNPAFFNLANGAYRVFVSDNTGCFDSLDVVVGSDSVAVIAPNDTTICEGQEVFLEATGMNTMSWTGNGSFSNGASVSPTSTTTYVVLGTNPNGCEDTDTMVVTVEPVFDPTIQPAGPFCDGTEDVQLITADPGGIWSGQGVTASGVFQPSTLTSGTYTVKYEFEGVCGSADSIEIGISSDFDATINPVPTLCEGDDALTLTSATPGGLWFGTGMQGQNTDSLSPVFDPGVAGGGTHTITHIIEGACGDTATLDINVTAADVAAIDPVPDFCPTGTTQRLTATPSGGTWSGTGINTSGDFDPTSVPGPGSYTVTYTPSGSCVVTDDASVTVVTQITLDDATVALSCFGDNNGSLEATVSEGQEPYVYNWQHDNTLTGPTATGLSAGSYPLTVTDNLGCSDTKTLLVTEPTELVFSNPTDITDDPCFGACQGAVTFFVSGGTVAGDYTYTLNGVTQNSSTFTGLCADDYTVTITDDNGCVLTESFTLGQPEAIVVSAAVSADFCNQNTGAIDITVSGGSSPYTFSWDNGVTTEDISNLASGNYEVTITDASGCVLTETFTVANTPGPQLTGDFIPVQCFGENNGKAYVTVTGGTAPYNYSWNTGSTQDTARNLPAGTYNVTVTDDQGCIATEEINVMQPSVVTVATVDDTTICDGQTLDINLGVSGGNGAPYAFDVNGNALTSSQLLTDQAGTKSVVATDRLGCLSQPMVFDLDYHAPLQATYDSIIVCPGDDATVSVNPTGGKPDDYMFSWSNGTTGNPTTYTTTANQAYDSLALRFTDACSTPFLDTVPIYYYANAVPIINPTTGCVPLDVNFRLQNTNYSEVSWDFGDGTTTSGGLSQNHTYTTVGNFEVTVGVVTNDGCQNQVTVPGVAVYPNPSGTILQNPSRITEANTEASFSFMGSDIMTGSWLLTQGEDTVLSSDSYPLLYTFDSDTATYELQGTMISNRGCETPVKKTVQVFKEIRMFIPNAFTPGLADGKNDVFSIGTTGLETQQFSIVIYNRWGELLFKSTDQDFAWDGTYRGNLVQPGAYTWVINYEDEFGKMQELSGVVLVLQ